MSRRRRPENKMQPPGYQTPPAIAAMLQRSCVGCREGKGPHTVELSIAQARTFVLGYDANGKERS